jgi:aspartate/methionine/tyrosine aminotransferase
MGRALAGRAVRLAEALEASSGPAPAVSRPALAPAHVRDAAKDALARGETHYTSRPGVADLRKAIARISTEQGFPATAESIVVTNGGAEALYITLQAVVGKGKRVAAPEPIQPNVAEMIGFIGGDLRRIATTPENRFLATPDDVFAVDPAVILLASPSPITGAALEDDALREIIARAADRGTTVILDRSLIPALYDPTRATFSAPELGAGVVTIGSFSSGYGLDGWRVGYFTAPPDRMKEMRELKQAMSICTTAVSQFAALAALDGPTDWLTERRSTYAANLASATAILTAAGIAFVIPDAYPALVAKIPDGAQSRRDFVGLAPGFNLASTTYARLDLSSPSLAADLAALTGESRS